MIDNAFAEPRHAEPARRTRRRPLRPAHWCLVGGLVAAGLNMILLALWVWFLSVRLPLWLGIYLFYGTPMLLVLVLVGGLYAWVAYRSRRRFSVIAMTIALLCLPGFWLLLYSMGLIALPLNV